MTSLIKTERFSMTQIQKMYDQARLLTCSVGFCIEDVSIWTLEIEKEKDIEYLR